MDLLKIDILILKVHLQTKSQNKSFTYYLFLLIQASPINHSISQTVLYYE